MVPNGWLHTTLGNVMSFKNGLNFTKADIGETIKIVGVADFKDLSELKSTENLDSINVAGQIKNEELLTNGDLLFVRSNGNKDLIGRCLFFPEVTERLSFSGFTIRGRADSSIVQPQYMAYVARSTFFKNQISQCGGGTNISNLSQQILNDIEIQLPPLPEQKKIAKILSTWDQAISTTEQLLANSQQQKKALMQQLLTGKKRLLDKNGVRFSGEWRTGKLSSLVGKIFGGGTPSRANPELWGGKIPWVTVKDLISTRIDGAQEFINERGLLESSSNLVPAGTVILSTRMAVGKTVIASCDVAINQDLKAISSSEKVCSESCTGP